MAIHAKLGVLVVIVAGLLGAVCAQPANAAEVTWPEEWLAFGPVPERVVPDEDALDTVPKELVIEGERLRPRKVRLYNDKIDLGALFGGKESGKTVYLFAPIHANEDTEVHIGTGLDWRMQWWVDGELVFDTMRAGNQVIPIHMSNHTFTVPLSEGQHVMAVRAISGSYSFVFAAGLVEEQLAQAPQLSMPQEWTAFGPVDLAPDAITGRSVDRAALLDGKALNTVPEELVVDGEGLRGRPVRLENNHLNLGDLFDGAQQGKAAYLVSTISVDQDRDVWLGAGANWWMQWWVDGRPVYDTLVKGNEDADAALTNHVFKVPMSAGEHVLAACVVSGDEGFALHAGGPHALALRPLEDVPSGEYVRARHRHLLETRELTPDQTARAYLAIAQSYLDEEEYDAAQGEFTWVIEMPEPVDTRVAQARLGLATIHSKRLEDEAARQQLEAVLDMDDELAAQKEEASWRLPGIGLLRRIRPSRPRLFLNDEMWPGMRARALGEGRHAYERMQQRTDGLPPLEEIDTGDWGLSIAPAAFVYLMTQDKAVLAKIDRMLEKSLDQYELAYSRCKTWGDARMYNVSHAPTRISWLAGFDWVWNDLEPARRLELAARMIRTIGRHKELYPNFANWKGSFYAGDNLYWYTGLACLDEDLSKDDHALGLELLKAGFDDHRKLFELRGSVRMDDGALRPRLEYTLPAYPHAEWKFFHSWRSAVSLEIPKAWHHTALMPNHAYWNLLPPKEPGHLFRHFGLGQAWHNPGYIAPESWMRAFGGYLAQHILFYEDTHPDMARLARHLWQRMGYLRAGKYGYIPFWSEIWSPVDEHGAPLPENLPLARHFAGNGTVLMRTGSGPTDTYALFNAGGGVDCSPQYDATHFAIFKQGFLALDSGTRNSGAHSRNYWPQTVAHNCVLIRMPSETFPFGSLGQDLASNSGGQRRRPDFAKMLAFETSPLFAYAASDATGTYHRDKCARMVRQFLFFPPNHFVVFDRVAATQAGYPKKWLLHTSNEPKMDGNTFQADQGQGRLFWRTHYPLDAQLVKIGGPGEEFWADGRNWPLTEEWFRLRGPKPVGTIPEVMGHWRVEVRPGAAREQDYFLHLLQTAGQSEQEMVDSSVREIGDRIELTFAVNGRTYTLGVNKTGEVGGYIRIEDGGEALVDRPLTQEIMPQSGLALRD